MIIKEKRKKKLPVEIPVYEKILNGLVIKINSETGTGREFKIKELHPDAKYCKINFEDNGIGFELQYSELIFEIF